MRQLRPFRDADPGFSSGGRPVEICVARDRVDGQWVQCPEDATHASATNSEWLLCGKHVAACRLTTGRRFVEIKISRAEAGEVPAVPNHDAIFRNDPLADANYHAELMAHLSYHRNRVASDPRCSFCREDDKLFPMPVERAAPPSSASSSGPPAMPSLACDRNWPEDFAHENGQYACGCIVCELTFIGHKQRNVCKLCDAKSRAPETPTDPPTATDTPKDILRPPRKNPISETP